MSKVYKARTLFTGYNIGLQDEDLYVGVPTKFGENGMIVKYNDESMVISSFKNDKVHEETFDDKFRVGEKYTLFYFPWKVAKGFRCLSCGEMRLPADKSDDPNLCRYCK